MTHSYDNGGMISEFDLGTDVGLLSSEITAIAEDGGVVGLSLYGLLAGPVLAAVALATGWGWLAALVAFSLGGSTAILSLALVNNWRTAPASPSRASYGDQSSDMATA